MTVKKIKPPRMTEAEEVESWMDKLDHPMKEETVVLRSIIKHSNKQLTERIKWNAPSYYYSKGVPADATNPEKIDLVTFGPYKAGKILLVFHHPAIVKVKSKLLEGDYKDRRLANFENMKAIKDNKAELERIMQELIKYIEKK